MHHETILQHIKTSYEAILGENLVGIYVHGSIAFGCFDPRVSDIDFLVIVKDTPSVSRKMQLLETLLALTPDCPKKGLEMSVVSARHCRPFVYPTPYAFHFSNAHLDRARRDPLEYCTNFHGIDKDLAAHITVTRAVGQVLCGKPIDDVFGEVPREHYLDSIRYDVENAVEDIRENPVYVILNLCRVTAYLREGLVLSKKSGGEWGLAHLPDRYQPILQSALTAYTAADRYDGDQELEQQFAIEMLAEIFRGKDNPT
jgi:streptomycin 3"-adenylyltransferase